MMFEYLANMDTEQALTALISAGSTAIVAAIIAALKTPGDLKLLRQEFKAFRRMDASRSRRLFRKVRRIENILLDEQIRQGRDLTGLYADMRGDQRDEADLRDTLEGGLD